MTTVQALREIYKALGGSGADITDNMLIPEALILIAGKVATIQGLPAVTTTENGKIMKVVEGEWALADDAIEA